MLFTLYTRNKENLPTDKPVGEGRAVVALMGIRIIINYLVSFIYSSNTVKSSRKPRTSISNLYGFTKVVVSSQNGKSILTLLSIEMGIDITFTITNCHIFHKDRFLRKENRLPNNK